MGRIFAGVSMRAAGEAFADAAFAGVTLVGAVFVGAVFVGAVFVGAAFACVILEGAAFADDARRTPLPLAFGWASSVGAALTFALTMRRATWFGSLLPRAGRPALWVSRLGIEGFDLTLVICAAQPGRRAHRAVKCTVFTGALSAAAAQNRTFAIKSAIYSVSHVNFSASNA
jgi:hypothetical protein